MLTYAVQARPGDEPDTKVWAVRKKQKGNLGAGCSNTVKKWQRRTWQCVSVLLAWPSGGHGWVAPSEKCYSDPLWIGGPLSILFGSHRHISNESAAAL